MHAINPNPVDAKARLETKIRRYLWCPGAESNHRHEDFQSTALPLSYPGTGCVLDIAKRLGASLLDAPERGVQRDLAEKYQCGFCLCDSASIAAASMSSGSSEAIAYAPVSQRARSRSAHRFEQKGRNSFRVSFPHEGQIKTIPHVELSQVVNALFCAVIQRDPLLSIPQAMFL